MGYREAQELARIRQELRDRILSRNHQDANGLLESLRAAAENDDTGPELRGEYQRWKLRFELL